MTGAAAARRPETRALAFALTLLLTYLPAVASPTEGGGLIGAQVAIRGEFRDADGTVTNTRPPDVVTAGPQVEIPSMAGMPNARRVMSDYEVLDSTVDIGADTITLTFARLTKTNHFADGPFVGYIFAILNDLPEGLDNAYIHPKHRLPGMTDSHLSIEGNEVLLNVAGLLVRPEDSVVIVIPTQPIPVS